MYWKRLIGTHVMLTLSFLLSLVHANQNADFVPVPPGSSPRFRTLFYVPQDVQAQYPGEVYPNIFYFNHDVTPGVLRNFFGAFAKKGRSVVMVQEEEPKFELPSLEPFEETASGSEDISPGNEMFSDTNNQRKKREIASNKIQDQGKQNNQESQDESQDVAGAAEAAPVLDVSQFKVTPLPDVETPSSSTDNETEVAAEELPTPEAFFWKTTRPMTRIVTLPGRPFFRRPFIISPAEIDRRLEEERLMEERAHLRSKSYRKKPVRYVKRKRNEYDIDAEYEIDEDRVYYDTGDNEFTSLRKRDGDDSDAEHSELRYVSAPRKLNDGYDDDLFGLKMYGMDKPEFRQGYRDQEVAGSPPKGRRRRVRRRKNSDDNFEGGDLYYDRPQSKLANV